MATFAITMLISKDVARSRDFYRDILGLTVGEDQPPYWVDFKLEGGALLGIHPEDAASNLSVVPGSLSNGFAVEDVDAFIADIKLRGVSVMREPHDESFGRLAIITDPDGYIVQIFTPTARAAAATPANGQTASVTA